jgi:outer membrane lipoprotein LolB
MRRSAALPLLALLTACAIAPPAPQPADVAAIRAFELSGRVAVRVETRGYSARLTWAHAREGESVRLYSPVGTVLATIETGADGAILATADRKTFRSHDVQGLTREVLGWDLPLEGLQHWVLARPDPDAPIEGQQRDARGRLLSLAQRGWKISYLGYAGDGVLPSGLTLAYGELTIRLVIDRWASVAT